MSLSLWETVSRRVIEGRRGHVTVIVRGPFPGRKVEWTVYRKDGAPVAGYGRPVASGFAGSYTGARVAGARAARKLVR